MGWKLAKAARDAGLAGLVSDRARLALDHMCWAALDNASENRSAAEYHGGHNAIAAALLGLDYTENAGKSAVRRALAELTREGLIERIGAGVGIDRAVYRIEVGNRWAPPTPPVENSNQDGLL